MKAFARRSLLLAACVAVMSLVFDVGRAVGDGIAATYKFAKDFAVKFTLDAVKLVAGAQPESKGPTVVLVQAKAFVQRILKRERPRVMPGWRMCPSI
ncbi:hypothetical protein [uncultured Rhodoferax sp.]|uniref:hypothetical protein n=1 Tax=uncultured Rhodoferax sp. TaxID=223188 RepID=UPI0025E48533|nr:hypothetical protein [uncultured Rhodoferax sp.]